MNYYVIVQKMVEMAAAKGYKIKSEEIEDCVNMVAEDYCHNGGNINFTIEDWLKNTIENYPEILEKIQPMQKLKEFEQTYNNTFEEIIGEINAIDFNDLEYSLEYDLNYLQNL